MGFAGCRCPQQTCVFDCVGAQNCDDCFSVCLYRVFLNLNIHIYIHVFNGAVCAQVCSCVLVFVCVRQSEDSYCNSSYSKGPSR